MSVLEDLSLKCPPAEVCRDAFNRMAKATITMCMSSTGFGEQAKQALEASKGKSSKPRDNAQSESKPEVSATKPAKPKGHGARPAPKFDMNLRALFTEEETVSRPFGNLNTADWVRQGRRFSQQIDPKAPNPTSLPPAAMPPPPAPMQPPHAHPMGNIDPTLQPGAFQPAQTADMYVAMPPQQPTFAAVGDMDFLDNFATAAGDFAPEGAPVANFDMFDMQGFDGTHDWSDGNQMDIFEGYFFGNAPS